MSVAANHASLVHRISQDSPTHAQFSLTEPMNACFGMCFLVCGLPRGFSATDNRVHVSLAYCACAACSLNLKGHANGIVLPRLETCWTTFSPSAHLAPRVLSTMSPLNAVQWIMASQIPVKVKIQLVGTTASLERRRRQGCCLL